MSYHSTRQVDHQDRRNENKPNKDFNACYNDFFNPMMKIISSAVDLNIGYDDLFNKIYLDAVKFMSMTKDNSKEISNRVFNSAHYKDYKFNDINFYNIISHSKGYILKLYKDVYNAKIGLGYCNDVIKGYNNKKKSVDLLNKCKVDEGIMSLYELRDKLCEDAVELLTRVTEEYDNENGISNNILELANCRASQWEYQSMPSLTGSGEWNPMTSTSTLSLTGSGEQTTGELNPMICDLTESIYE
ncbi:MAG: hypothetical protein K2P53_04120 [Rickettsiales bacterium]|jgi:hypothetical protein|nr:hypothetical protein [Rickettsiales bacterium]